MGMSPSQARLLFLTARMSDVELEAQYIQSEKIALATQKDYIYNDYCEALDATTIKVAYVNGASRTYVDANYNSLCNWNENRLQQYALKNNNTGKLIVSQEILDAYDDYEDKYAFAYALMGFEGKFGWGELDKSMGKDIGIGASQRDYGIPSNTGTGYSLYMTECEQNVFNALPQDSEIRRLYEEIDKAESDDAKQKALDCFRDKLYTECASKIYEQMTYSKDVDYQSDDRKITTKAWEDMKQEFNYYINLWTAITQAGGCEAVDPEYTSGEAGNKWLNGMVESAQISIMVFNNESITKEWKEANVATTIGQNYLQEFPDDEAAKKAEIKYEHDLAVLNAKDSRFDTELTNLEAERNAISKEIEAIGNVRDENIERTFGIFS